MHTHTQVLRRVLLEPPGKVVDLSVRDDAGRRAFDVVIDSLSVPMLDLFFKANFGVVRDCLFRALRAFAALEEVSQKTGAGAGRNGKGT